MLLTEQIQVKKSKELSNICHLAKNLYNLTNFYVRQEYFNSGNWLRYYDYLRRIGNPILKVKKNIKEIHQNFLVFLKFPDLKIKTVNLLLYLPINNVELEKDI